MPFTLDDLDRISVRVGMGTKTLRQMSDQQFMAWLRGQGAQGSIGMVKTAPGELSIPIDERVRVLNTLEEQGFYIPDVMGAAGAERRLDPAVLERALSALRSAAGSLLDASSALDELGEFDPRVNVRASIHGAMELVELLTGAVEHSLREARHARQGVETNRDAES